MDHTRIGFVGAGKIGEPMVERLLAAGRHPAVFARRPEVRDRLTRLGATMVPTAEDLATSDVVIACLFDDAQLTQVAGGIIERMTPGSVFVSHTTGSPRTIQRLNGIGDPRGVAIVDAPFSGTPELIRQGTLTVLLAGADDAMNRSAEIVGAYAATIHRMGPSGTALSAKLLNNALFAACTQVTLSALKAATDLGITEHAFLDLLADASGGSAASRYIAASGDDAEAYSRRISRYLTKDLDAATTAADDLAVDIGELLAAARLGPMDLGEPVSAAHTR
ncbi:NAD(P)-binding domain-containing protein [Gordonia hankookensis]|uniref:NAD(P)-dependent oxidoreductase n=1 Tax=Gordonia hankookensis TaxID=589403 RepID=A0ABR7W9Z8_9ACTN|nr:NAD(P)-dependent oxidoreductase [Gordonia hankookensis]